MDIYNKLSCELQEMIARRFWTDADMRMIHRRLYFECIVDIEMCFKRYLMLSTKAHKLGIYPPVQIDRSFICCDLSTKDDSCYELDCQDAIGVIGLKNITYYYVNGRR
jgi:hypothetical protein